MPAFDSALKQLLRGAARVLMQDLTGGVSTRWIDHELPPFPTRRADLLGEAAHHEIIHIELQSTNDASMPLRMAEYALKLETP